MIVQNSTSVLLGLLLVSVGQAQQPLEAPVSPRYALDAQSPQRLRQLFRYTGETLPVVSAHRGGARTGFPENCLATFENTLQSTFAIMEIDPRMSRDGAIVVHHDATLDRTTTGSGRVSDHTLEELMKLRLKDPEGRITDHRIPTLDELLEWARGKTILVLDQKDVSVEERVRKIEEHRAEAYAMLIVYSFEGAQECYRLNPNVMMEVMIPDRAKFHEFDQTGVPWSNVVAFVGHTPPQDIELLRMIHAKGACCLAGTSRNLDRTLAFSNEPERMSRELEYRKLLECGVDLIETDLPVDVGRMLYDGVTPPASKASYFRVSPNNCEE